MREFVLRVRGGGGGQKGGGADKSGQRRRGRERFLHANPQKKNPDLLRTCWRYIR
jgi:hypothetical protein